MFRIPKWAVKSTDGDERRALLEFRLSPLDVAAMCEVNRRTVQNWTTIGKQGVKLRHRTFHAHTGRPRYAYRITDIREFAALFGIPLHYGALHPALRAEWKLDGDE